jgi:glucose/arabinose dehydrogenase
MILKEHSQASLFQGWEYNFFVATLRGIHLHRFSFNPQTDAIEANEKLLQETYGRLRDVVQGPDGLYILTSNRDGRGSPAPNDDRILRLIPG